MLQGEVSVAVETSGLGLKLAGRDAKCWGRPLRHSAHLMPENLEKSWHRCLTTKLLGRISVARGTNLKIGGTNLTSHTLCTLP